MVNTIKNVKITITAITPFPKGVETAATVP